MSKSSDNHHESNILTESSTSSSQRKSTEEIDKSELVSKEILYANDDMYALIIINSNVGNKLVDMLLDHISIVKIGEFNQSSMFLKVLYVQT